MISSKITVDCHGNRVLEVCHNGEPILFVEDAMDLDRLSSVILEAYSLGALDHLTDG